jgi:hypothetical protein
LLNDLKNIDRNNTPWVIVTLHRPSYSSNDAYRLNTTLQNSFDDIFLKNNIDLVLEGYFI